MNIHKDPSNIAGPKALKELNSMLRFSSILTETAMAPHSNTLAWKIPWTEKPGWLQSMGSLRVGHDSVTSLSLFTFMHWRSSLLMSEVAATAAASAAKLLQSYRTLCDPIDSSPPGSAVPGILQARTLEWVAISFSNA